MTTLRPGSHAYRILQLLSAAGEFPARSLHLLGSVRTYVPLVHRLEHVQQFRTDTGDDLGVCKMLSVSGKRDKRTIRLHKSGLPLLNALHPGALEQYLTLTGNHHFSSNDAHVLRNHRVAETLAVCQAAEIEFLPCALPPLQKNQTAHVIQDRPSFYIARSLKKLDNTEMNKSMFTRLTGALFAHGICYAVYNSRSTAMKWSGMGEYKTMQHLSELARMNAGISRVNHALLLGESMDAALQTILESEKYKRIEFSFARIYPHLHFLPMDRNGIRLLKILTLPDWNEQMLSVVFPAEWRSGRPGIMEYDAKRDETLILSHLDGDLARLIRLRQALQNSTVRFEVVCFPWQAAFLHEYLGDRVGLRQVSMDDLEAALGLTRDGDAQEEVIE